MNTQQTPAPTAERLPVTAVVFRAAVSLVLVAAGVGVAAALVATAPDAGRNAAKAPPPRIAVLEVRALPVERFVRGYGTARALDSADVPARVTAVVDSTTERYAVGARVAKGELLVVLDARDFLEQVAMAEQAIRAIDAQVALLDAQERAASQSAELARSDRALAATDLERVEKAAAEGAAQPREVDRARQNLIAASRAAVAADDALAQVLPRRQALVAQRASESSRLELARLSAQRCRIEAPIDGVVQLADLEIGESVNPGMTVARVVDQSRIEIPVRIPASSRSLAPEGAKAVVTGRARGSSFDAAVARVAPEDDPASRTATVFVELEQDVGSASALAPGAFVEARIAPGGTEPRIAVPRRAIRDEQVAVVEDGRVRMKRVVVDFSLTGAPAGAAVADSDWAVLSSGLDAGALVVLDGSRSLVEGQEVAPVRPAEAAAAAGGSAG
ncbi:MAG: efflux RND transporter periplasmic adaptor subunit [Planctomycetota bacterium]